MENEWLGMQKEEADWARSGTEVLCRITHSTWQVGGCLLDDTGILINPQVDPSPFDYKDKNSNLNLH